jgi:hypothetical protein
MAVLWVCLTKVTREDFTGVVFTAAISYALVFGMNLFLLGALMGDLRVSARESSSAQEALSLAAESEEESESASLADLDPEDAMEPPGGTAPAKPAQVNPPATAALNRAQAGAVPPSPAPNLQAAMSRAPVSAKPPVTSAFALKAILQNGTNSTAMVFTGVRTYSITLGDTIFVQTTEGAKSVRLEALDATSAVLDVAGEEVRLAP